MRIHRLLLRYLVRGDLLHLTDQEKRIVQYGFAYFDGDKTIRVDEPLVLLAASNWFNSRGFPPIEHVIDSLRSAPGRGEGWEDFLALYFSRAFQGQPPLHHVFTFHGTPPPWSQDSAELVALSIEDEIISVSGRHVSISACVRLSWVQRNELLRRPTMVLQPEEYAISFSV